MKALGRCLVLIPLALAAAQAGPTDTPPAEAKPVPIALFDGKSLHGWTLPKFSRPGPVTVRDGVIVLAEGRPMTGITSDRPGLPTTEYELSYEARRTDGKDFFAAATFPVGKTFLTFVNGGWGGNVTGLSRVDFADASENETTRFVKYENKTWYRFRVRVTGKVVRCWIDDKPVVTLVHEGRNLDTRIETRTNQPLGFATWESAAELRSVSMRKLTPAETAELDKAADE
jgi:hypothetical protein